LTDVLERPRVASPAARTGTPARPAPGSKARAKGSGRRADIEGLRAIAVVGVLAFHAGLPFLPGGYVGVDVFFVISGFLITGLVASEVELTGRLSLTRFYARRIKRLLPAAVLVLVVTAIASAFVLPPAGREAAGGDIVSAALYVSNWHFAIQQTDYLSVQTSPSPVLHYWSLSVEEQYYVLWPLVLLGTVALARRYRLVTRRAVQVAVVLVGAISLCWSLFWTTSNPPFAFFGLMTRAWELALGGSIALGAVALARLAPWARAVVGWAGLAAIGWSMLVLTEDVPFPGTAALVPVLGAGAVLVAGLPRKAAGPPDLTVTRVDPGPGGLLSTRPMRSVGRVSYSLYLWHWPPLVLTSVALGHSLSPWLGVVVVLLAAIPAMLSHRYLEEPFRHSVALVRFPRRAGIVAAVLTSLAVLVGFGVAATTPVTKIDVTVMSKAPRAGQQGSSSPPVATTVEVDPQQARTDLPAMYGNGCEAGILTTEPARCVFGVKDASKRMALLGDSHAAQWFPALDRLATKNGFALEVDSKSACTAADVLQWEMKNAGGVYQRCTTFRNAVLDSWQADTANRPDVVVVASRDLVTVIQDGQRLSHKDSLKAQRDGLERTYESLRQMGIQVVVIRDSMAPKYDIPDCLTENAKNPDTCSYRASDTAPALYPELQAARAADVPVIDLTGEQCPDGVCPPIIDGHVVYRDSHHLTASFVQTLTGKLRAQLARTQAWTTLTS
jgi:peptidoglycan/LPS O-acetylase OafA/YrhL